MIKTKSILDQPEKADGKRILVSRKKPVGISMERLKVSNWMKELAPSKDLMEKWKKREITWGQFCKGYREEMSCQGKTLAELAETAVGDDITLICHEPEHNPHCHRHILKRIIAGNMPT